MRTKCIAAVCAFMLIGALTQSAHAFAVRPYLKVGYLVNGPSAEDLGYTLVGGGSLDQYLDVNKLNFGAGVQLFAIESSNMLQGFVLRLGVDAGARRLFTSTFQADPNNYYWSTSETAFSLLGVVELATAKMPLPLFLQAGLGLDFVLWNWQQELRSRPYNDNSGLGTNLAAMVGGGVSIPLSPMATIPIMLRIDNSFRYGSLTSISAIVGLNIKL